MTETKPDRMSWILGGLSFLIGLVKLDHPRFVVFDEALSLKLASQYANGSFFFTTEPPLGKLLLTAFGAVGGLNGNFDPNRVGDAIPADVPLWHMRLLPVLCQAATVMITYRICADLGLSSWGRFMAATLVLADPSLLTSCRVAMSESVFVLSVLATVGLCLRFKVCNDTEDDEKPESSRWSVRWWSSLLSLGVMCGVCISLRYTGVAVWLWVTYLTAEEWWKRAGSKDLSDKHLLHYALSLMGCLLFLPVVLYIGVFMTHLSLISNTGPHDYMMTSAFQASLKGGLSNITAEQPSEIAFGSEVTIRHAHGHTPCWLHSHNSSYPEAYPDGRRSSGQQQITCYTFRDTNNGWIIKRPDRDNFTMDDPPQPVRHNDVIELVHSVTKRLLNSHDIGAPNTPMHQEVTCYTPNHRTILPPQTKWRVEIVSGSDTWQSISTYIRLVHVNSGRVLTTTGSALGDWGFRQLEVCADGNVGPSSVWNVEEHRYPEDALEKYGKNQPPPQALSLFAKFLEVQKKILFSPVNEEEHAFSSKPLDWIKAKGSVGYWKSSDSNAQIYLMPNVVSWRMGVLHVVALAALVALYLARRQRLCFDMIPDTWDVWLFSVKLLVGTYCLLLAVHYLSDQTLFLYLYLPALPLKFIATAFLVDHLAAIFPSSHPFRLSLLATTVTWVTSVFYVTWRVLGVARGTENIADDTLRELNGAFGLDIMVPE